MRVEVVAIIFAMLKPNFNLETCHNLQTLDRTWV